MENNVLVSKGCSVQDAASSPTQQNQSKNQEESSQEMRKTTPPLETASCCLQPPKLVPSSALAQFTELIDTYNLTKEQLVKMYDDYIAHKLESASPSSAQQETQVPMDDEMCVGSEGVMVTVCEAGGGERGCAEGVGVVYRDTPPPLTSVVEEPLREDGPLSEIGQKRKQFTLEEELNVQVSPFVEALLDRAQSVVAQVIKRYMSQYSIPQREVVDITGLNQSHLSQHFLHGVTMKRAKRIKLYQWFEEDQKTRTGKVQNADGSLSAVLESPRVEGKRRPRWKWSPISTQILTEAFKKNQFPTRDQRMDLARICNEAEVAMNNGAEVRGPEGDTEGITEQRVNTWFTNRRKGLGTPITPPPNKVSTPGTSLYPPMLHPTLLRASPATTPVLARAVPSSYNSLSPQRAGLFGGTPSSDRPMPNTMQSLVSQIQESQQKQNMPAPIPSLLSRPPVALPLAIALPGASHPNLIGSPSGNHMNTLSPAHQTPLHTVTMPFSLSPALISPSQVQALISQFHSPTSQVTTANKSHDKPTQSHDRETGTPLTVQSVTVASDPSPAAQDTASPTHPHKSVEGAGLTQLAGGIILNSSQLQALVNQIQTQQKLGGEGPVQVVTALPAGYTTVTTM